MRRGTGRHNLSAGDRYIEREGVAASPCRWDRERRAPRAVSVIGLLLLPVLLVLVLAAPAVPYWDQPDEQATITTVEADGTITQSPCGGDRRRPRRWRSTS